MTDRRQQIIDTAADLFAAHGFHGVSVHDIGGACGISGPALYKHFPSKQALLAATLTEISQTLMDEGRRRVADADGPASALSALIDWHIDFALSHPSRIIVQDREWPNLDTESRAATRTTQLAYIDIWVGVLRELRPDLDQPTARATVQAGFGLLNSTPHSARISASAMREVLGRMATNALLGKSARS
jgi:AcrR family transcriptional regulator